LLLTEATTHLLLSFTNIFLDALSLTDEMSVFVAAQPQAAN